MASSNGGGLRSAPLICKPLSVMRNSERRWSELCARRALGRYYRTRGVATYWQRGSEPPDWWVDIDGVRFAVEVTRAFGSVEPAGHEGNRPAEQQWAFFRNLGREINALVAGIPGAGSHYLHMHSMVVSATERKELLDRVRQYVLRHLSYSEAAEEVLFRKKGRGTYATISIKKETNKGAGVGWSYSSHILPVSGPSIEHELQTIVTSAVSSKTSRTVKLVEPKILVIVDTYMARDTFWENLKVDAGPFVGVFRASPSGQCQLLSGSGYALRHESDNPALHRTAGLAPIRR